MKKHLTVLFLFVLLLSGCAKEEKKEQSLKLDNNKDYIYAADYHLPTTKESYMGYLDKSKEIKASDIVVPYINIDSDDAKKVNKEIYNLYEKLINTFNANVEEEVWFTTVKYNISDKDETIATFITTESGGTSVPSYSYYSYIFSKKDGHLLSFKEVCESLGYGENVINAKVKDVILEKVDDIAKNFGNKEDYITQSLNDYEENIRQGKLNYFVDDNGKLNMYIKIIAPIQDGYINELITMD